MNGKERVSALMQGLPFDQVPFCPLMSLYGGKLTSCDLRTYYTDPSAYADGQQAVAEMFHPDVLAAPFIMAGMGEAFGGELRYFDDQPPNLAKPAISSLEELSVLRTPDIDGNPSLFYFRESLRKIVANHGHDTIIAAPVLGPFDVPIMIMGLEGWLETVLFSSDGLKRMLDITGPFFLRFVDALLADGADALVLPSAFLLPTIITREMAENIVVPVLREIYAQLPCPVILHSVGAPFLPLLDLLSGLPNVGGAVIDEGDNISVARDTLGPDAILFGGLDGGRIWKYGIDEIKQTTRNILEERRDDSKFVFTATGPDIAWQTPPELIHAIQQTIAETGVK